MEKFYVDNGPHLKSNYNTTKMMKHLLIALCPLIVFSCYKNGFYPYQKGYGTLFMAFRPIFLILIGIITSFCSEALFAYFILKKKDYLHIKEYLKYSYFLFPGLFLALIIPLHTPFSILIIGVVFATIIGKMIFGGFGFNVFNPALIGKLFIMSTYYTNIVANGSYFNQLEINTVGGATPLTHLQSINYLGTYHNVVGSFGTLLDYLWGFIPGVLGETSAILCLIGFFYLLFTKVITWHIPTIYIITVFILTAIIGFYHDLGLWYPLFHILSGGLMFGAIFMATDPVTSPVTPIGQVIYALCLGFLTVLFRFLTSFPEGVLTAILTLNMFVFIIDRFGARARFNKNKVIIFFSSLLLIMALTTYYMADRITKEPLDESFKIITTSTKGNNKTYTVTHKAYHGLIKADITIDTNSDKVITITILEQQEDVWAQIENQNYIKQIIANQSNLTDLDSISGATYTTNYLKQMVIKTVATYNLNR